MLLLDEIQGVLRKLTEQMHLLDLQDLSRRQAFHSRLPKLDAVEYLLVAKVFARIDMANVILYCFSFAFDLPILIIHR